VPVPALTAASLPTVIMTPAASPTPSTPQHIFVIVLENNPLQGVLSIPYFSALAKRGVLLSNYHAITHPSEPNYIAMIAGDTFVFDDGVHDLPQTNLVDLLETAHMSWKAYLEEYPSSCFNGVVAGDSQTGQYARKHNPFISFDDIRTNPQRCSRLVNADALAADIAANQLPAFSLYVPNLRNDAHDTSPAYAAKWLSSFLDPKLADPGFIRDTLVVVTFDEDNGAAGNLIYTVLLGSMLRANSSDSRSYTHYSLLRTIEDNFSLGTLNRNDAQADPFSACDFSAANAKCPPVPAQ
jgi:hypothetical protein